jgi:hypothetical protein
LVCSDIENGKGVGIAVGGLAERIGYYGLRGNVF